MEMDDDDDQPRTGPPLASDEDKEAVKRADFQAETKKALDDNLGLQKKKAVKGLKRKKQEHMDDINLRKDARKRAYEREIGELDEQLTKLHEEVEEEE